MALAGGRAITDADTASIVAAGRYLLRRPDLADLGTLPAVRFNDVATPARGGFDPDEFRHAWARGRDMTVDIFAPDWNVWDWVDKDLEEVRRIFHVSRVFSTSGPPLHSVSAGMSALY